MEYEMTDATQLYCLYTVTGELARQMLLEALQDHQDRSFFAIQAFKREVPSDAASPEPTSVPEVLVVGRAGSEPPDVSYCLRQLTRFSPEAIHVRLADMEGKNIPVAARSEGQIQDVQTEDYRCVIISSDHYDWLIQETKEFKSEQKEQKSLFEMLKDGILIADKEGDIIYVNKAACEIFQRSPDKLVGYPFGYPITDKNDIELTITRQDGGECTVEMRASSIKWQGKSSFIVSLHDITEQKNKIHSLKALATQDELTGLYNHRTFYMILREEVERIKGEDGLLSLLMLDIDHFKQINDTYGHQAGDAILRELGKLLKQNTRKVDKAFRYGGEEIMILMPDTNERISMEIAERLRRLIAAYHFDTSKGTSINITISIGVACYPQHATTLDDLVSAVDTALYTAKRRGRNRVYCYGPDSLETSQVFIT